MAEWATLRGLNNFGNWLVKTRHNAALWPPELTQWFEFYHNFQGKLTQVQLCEWLARQTGDETLETYDYRIKTYEKWATIKDIKETRVRNIKELNFHAALGMTGFLSLRTRDGGRRPVFSDDSWIFRDVIKGDLDPFNDYYPEHPVGRSAGKTLAAVLDMMCIQNRGTSIHDFLVRADFAQGNPHWRQKDVESGGFLANLVEGKIYNLSLIQLEQIAGCMEAYLQKYNSKAISFEVTDLIKLLNRDKVENEMLQQPDYLPVSTIGQIVCWYCLDIGISTKKGYDQFVVKNLKIRPDRWTEIENGGEPSRHEMSAIAEVLGIGLDELEAARDLDARTKANQPSSDRTSNRP
jgi:hypothetical protein